MTLFIDFAYAFPARTANSLPGQIAIPYDFEKRLTRGVMEF